jgi:hypothetical protein
MKTTLLSLGLVFLLFFHCEERVMRPDHAINGNGDFADQLALYLSYDQTNPQIRLTVKKDTIKNISFSYRAQNENNVSYNNNYNSIAALIINDKFEIKQDQAYRNRFILTGKRNSPTHFSGTWKTLMTPPDSGNWSAEKSKALVASYWGKNVRNVFLHVGDTISVDISDGLFPFFLIKEPDKTILQLCGYPPYSDKEALISGGILRIAGISKGFTSIKIADSSTPNLQSKIDIFVFPQNNKPLHNYVIKIQICEIIYIL